MSVHNVFGVNLHHPMYDVDELLLEEDPCNLQTVHHSFLLKEQLTAFVSGSQIVSSPGIGQQQQQGGSGGGHVSTRDLEARAVIQVPLWVARAFVPRQHAIMVSPEKFSARSLLDFKAGTFLPLVAETKGQRYFDFGTAVSAFLASAEAERVKTAALELYKSRYVDVVREGLKKGSTGTRDSNLRSKLTAREAELYQDVAHDVKARNEWRRWLQ